MSNQLKNEDILKTRKTRVEALNERINQADTFISEIGKDQESLNINNLSRMQKIMSELGELRNKLNTNQSQNEIDTEVNNLPEKSLIALSVGKIKILNENIKLNEKQRQSDEYIKQLENQLLSQRLEIETLKKAENEQLVQVSTLEDQIRILKSKAFGYDISKKFDYYKDKELKQSQVAQVEDENLAYAMWEKENYAGRKMPTKLDQIQSQKQMWISNSKSNIDKLVNDIDASNRPVNNSINKGQLSTNMRKVSPMILNNNIPKGGY